MSGSHDSEPLISADRPIDRPGDDLLGYASFAKYLADTICSLKDPQGLVLAIHGPWGSGKTTLLNLVRYYILEREKEEQPVFVLFNPWWFSGHENIARAFLGQLRAVLPEKFRGFRKLGGIIGDLADSIGAAYAPAGVLGRLLKRKPKDVPELKRRLSDALRSQGRKILVLVDDIDRLTTDESRQIFTVIKALADFPNVIYLIAFDKEVAMTALDDRGVSGKAYLEKIVQVSFELPAVDKAALRSALFGKLDRILGDPPIGPFDQTHWGNVYYGGIDEFIAVPRDITRLINTLSVTYAAVRGEVNPVDFIAIESLRAFLPDVYDVVRSNQPFFAGHSPSGDGIELRDVGLEELKKFHNAWLDKVDEELRDSARSLLTRLFPKLECVWANTFYGAEFKSQWVNDLRVCSPDIFPIYFRLSVPLWEVGSNDLDSILRAEDDADLIKGVLRKAIKMNRPDGTTKARALVERLLPLAEDRIPKRTVPALVTALLQVGDELLVPQDERQGMFDLRNRLRIAKLLYRLLEREGESAREALLSKVVAEGSAPSITAYFIGLQEDGIEEERGKGRPPFISETCLDSLERGFVEHLEAHVAEGDLLSAPHLSGILYSWRKWGEEERVSAWVSSAIDADDGLKRLFMGFAQRSFSHSFGDAVSRTGWQIEPSWLSPFVDLAQITVRVESLLKGGKCNADEEIVLGQFIEKRMATRQENEGGQGPDSPPSASGN